MKTIKKPSGCGPARHEAHYSVGIPNQDRLLPVCRRLTPYRNPSRRGTKL